MNWLSACLISMALLVPAACGAPASENGAGGSKYRVHYELQPNAASGEVSVSLNVKQTDHLLREMSFTLGANATAPVGDGQIRILDNEVRWSPPAKGGQIRWQVTISHERSAGRYDAYLSKNWGIFRAEDVIPRAKTRTLQGSSSSTTLSFSLPSGWTAISEYGGNETPQNVSRPGRRFSQPTGWIAVGQLGIRRETIAGMQVAIAGPKGHSVRRMDMLALLNWSVPELASILGELPPRFTVVSANEPMWRGGLSAPQSVFLHADRPMISENATSTLLHELMHVALDFRAATGFDWITEGLAEYYSLELLLRGGAITTQRHLRALDALQEWSQEANTLCTRHSKGATTALALGVFRALDREIRNKSNGKSSLDDLAAALRTETTEIDVHRLRAIAADLAGAEIETLNTENLPGCSSLIEKQD